jgi:hypothetical protein
MKQLDLFAVSLLLGMGANAEAQGFFLDDWQAKTIVNPSFVAAAPSTRTSTVTVTVDAGAEKGRISKYVYGHNAAVWGGKLEQKAGVVTDISNLAPHIIRWPGGNMSNDYFWDAKSKETCPKDLPPNFSYSDMWYGANQTSWTMSLDSYYALLQKTKSTGIICVNYAYARYGTSANPVAAAAHYAANWVRYDKGRTRYWEIGNENFGSWETGYKIDKTYNKDGQPDTINGDLYGKHSAVFIDSMKAAAKEVGNDIKIGVVVIESQTGTPVHKNWNQGVMPHVAKKADFLVPHSYYTPYNENSTIATILNSASQTKSMKDFMANAWKTYAGTPFPPLALTEWGIFADKSRQQASYINGMHATLVLGELMTNQFGEATRWNFTNGDIGIFTGAYQLFPAFYYMYYFQKMFGDRLVGSTVTGDANVVSYASRFSSGQCGVALVNKNDAERVVELKLNDFTLGARYTYYVLTGGTDNGDFSRKVYINGKTTADSLGGPADYATLAPYGTTISGGSIKVVMPRYSVVYLLVESNPASVGPGVPNAAGISARWDSRKLSIQSSHYPLELEIVDLHGRAEIERTVRRSEEIRVDELDAGIHVVRIHGQGEAWQRTVQKP